MQVSWTDLGAAFALYLVLEGVMPFLNPQGMKRVLAAMSQLGDKQLRIFGLLSMLSGLALLHFLQR
jgi:uncharacterized protein YjeT (DUF2065 family)